MDMSDKRQLVLDSFDLVFGHLVNFKFAKLPEYGAKEVSSHGQALF